jgi:iron complex outermembrane receptor protein
MHYKTNFLAVIFIALLSGQCKAETPDFDIFSLSLEELLSVEVTGATLQSSTLQKVPAVVTVLTKDQINLYGFTHLSTALNYVSGYQIQRSDSSSFGKTVSSRSLKANGSAREILVLVDGQRLNSDWFGGAPNLLANFPVSHVERIEIIKGAGSALYGSNAYAGVINIITTMSNEVSVSAGLHGAKYIDGQFTHSFKGGSVSGFASKEDNDGENVEIYDPFTGKYEKTTDPNQGQLLYLKADWQDFEINASHQQNESEQYYTLGFVSGDKNFLSMQHQFLRVKHNVDFNEQWHLKTQLFISEHKYALGGKIIPAPIETFINGQIEEKDKGIELNLIYTGEQSARMLFGAEYRTPELTNTDANTYGAFNQYLPQAPTTGRTIKGAFFQYQDAISENVEYIIGARNDHYSDFGSHLSPRLGVNWQLNDEQVIKFIYGNSFRAPSRSETDVINSNAFVKNSNLKPEIFSTYDVLWQYSDDATHFSVDVFYNQVEDAVRQTQTSPITFINQGSGHSSGIEIDLLHMFDNQWQIRANLMKLTSYNKELYSDSDLAAGLILSYVSNKSTYSLLANYQSSKIDENSSEQLYSILPNRFSVEANIQYVLRDNLQLNLNVSNLLDKDNYGVAYRAPIIGGVKEKGRQANLSLIWSY